MPRRTTRPEPNAMQKVYSILEPLSPVGRTQVLDWISSSLELNGIPNSNAEAPSNINVSPDAVYAEKYAEMRRYRDYELTASTWYTTILIAILAALVAVKLTPGQSAISPLSSSPLPWILQTGVVLLTTLIGASGFFSVKYAYLRHSEIRDYVDQNLEPKWLKEKFSSKPTFWAPRHFIALNLVVLVAAIWIVAAV